MLPTVQADQSGMQAGPQLQAAPPAQGMTAPRPLVSRHISAEQHWASLAQVKPTGSQVCGGPQTPLLQTSDAEQQPVAAVHDSPVRPQLEAPLHVPLVAPGAKAQVMPAQQSPSAVQTPVDGTHDAAHVPSSQRAEQQSPFVPQAVPTERHAPQLGSLHPGGRQVKDPPPVDTQLVPAQQLWSWVPVHALPLGVQASVQRSTPSWPGTQGVPLQHWSRNWQTCPGCMQQPGTDASQPVGHAVVLPPKHRSTPFESGLQTSFFPSQQFCDAFTSVEAPQMFPGGLHAPPLSQVCSVGLQATSWATPVFTLQQAAVESQ